MGHLLPKGKTKAVLEKKFPSHVVRHVTTDYNPNTVLINALWDSLINISPNVQVLANKKQVSLARKRMAILNSLPAPIAEHLRKLMVPVADEKEGFDKISIVPPSANCADLPDGHGTFDFYPAVPNMGNTA